MSLRVATRPSKYICRACRRQAKLTQRRSYGNNAASSNPSPENTYDIITVGGGPVGLALLAAIKSSPKTAHLRCLLVEAQDLQIQKSWSMPKDLYSNRASSITPTNQQFLEAIEAWRHLDLSRIQPYNEMQVWDAANDSSIQFDWSSEAVAYNAPSRTIATMVENANLSQALLQRLHALQAEESLLSRWTVAGIENGIDDADGCDLSTWSVLNLQQIGTDGAQSTRRVATRLLVGADGINSPVRAFAGINTNGWDYGRHGVVATLKIEDSDPPQSASTTTKTDDLDSAFEDFLSEEADGSVKSKSVTLSNRAVAFQRFLPQQGGPIAILPLPNNHASLVWSTTPQIAGHLKSLCPAAFVTVVNAALRLESVDIAHLLTLAQSSSPGEAYRSELNWRLQHTQAPLPARQPPWIAGLQEKTVASFPLRLRNATAYTAPRVALAGDAAHTIHPLAGQGLNLGLGDAEALARSVEYAVEHGMDIGDLMSFETYSKERYTAAVQMSSGVDLLNSAYQLGASDGLVGSLLGKARGLGMWMIGALPGAKEAVMRRAD